tara:strand:+ start:863 stop:1363 length:501 start_codon:yes stop_codon:yes gene_type:complete
VGDVCGHNKSKERKMKYLLSVVVFCSFSSLADDLKELDPIIFMLDLSVNEGEKKQAEEFTHEIASNVLKVEPGTLIYEYYFDADNKAFLYEVYKSNHAAIEHVKNFRGSNWESRFGKFFSITSFSVLGNSSETLKKSLEGYTTDFRTLEGGFHKPAKNLGEKILGL